jgi:iron complex transport system substrate-binding protein
MKFGVGRTIIIAVLISMLPLAAACRSLRAAEEEPLPPTPRTITITDSAGREVELPLPLERVVVLNPRAAEVVHALGASDRVVAVSDVTARNRSLPGLYGKMVVVQGHGEPNYEEIVQLRPHLVITWGTHPRVDVNAIAATLAPAGIPVVGIDAWRLDTLFADIRILGELFTKETAAIQLLDFLQAQLDLLRGRTAGLTARDKVRVYAEHHAKEFFAVGPGTDWHRIIEEAGGVNVFADVGRPAVDVDPELVIRRNPQVILKQWGQIGFGTAAIDPIREQLKGFIARPGWENLEAVRDGRVYLVSMDLAFGPPAIIFMLYAGRILQPALFADVDPEYLLREYFRRFHGVEIQGTFIFPTP